MLFLLGRISMLIVRLNLIKKWINIIIDIGLKYLRIPNFQIAVEIINLFN